MILKKVRNSTPQHSIFSKKILTMTGITNKTILTSTALIILFIGMIVSCKKKETASSEYAKKISDIAMQYNKSCPKEENNGTRLESVTFTDNTLTFRLSLSDEAIVDINLDNTRDSIIENMSDNLKKFLIKGKCNLEYKYISPNDSSSITIVPNELGKPVSENK